MLKMAKENFASRLLIFIVVLILSHLSLASLVFSAQKVLVYQAKALGDVGSEEFLQKYLSELKAKLSGQYEVDVKRLTTKEVELLMKIGEVYLAGRLTFTLIRDSVSADWVFYRVGKSEPFMLYAIATKDRLDVLVEETIKSLKVFLEEKTLVEKVEFEGAKRAGEDLLRPKLKLKEGDILDLALLNEDLKNLYRTGHFENIEVEVKEGDRGITIVYKLKERETLKEIQYKGIKSAKAEDLTKISGLKIGEILTPENIDKALENIKAYYEQLGFLGTEIKVKTERVTPTQVKLVFDIKEGKKKYISKVEFLGAKAITEKELKDQLSVSEKSVFSPVKKYVGYIASFLTQEPKAEPGVYNLAYLYRDLAKIENLYKNRGYLDVKVGEPIVEEKEDEVYIKIPIEEGPQYRVAEIKVIQDLFPAEEILKRINTKAGKVVNLSELKFDESVVTHLFSDYGYAYAKVTTDIDKVGANQAKVTFKVDKGPVVFVNRIEIEGNTKTRDKVIRRDILLSEGWPYSAKRLEKSEERLQRLGFFEEVKVEKEKGTKEEELNLRVKVKEALTGTFSVGAAYSSSEKLVFITEITQRNWLGKGQRVGISAKIGTKSSRYSLNFFDPYFMDSRYFFGWSLYNYEIEYEDFTKDAKGGSIRVGYFFTPEFSTYLGYRFDDSKLKDVKDNSSVIIQESMKIHVTSAVEAGINYDSRNRFFLPTKGWVHGLALSYAGSFLGGDSEFLKFTGEHQVYFTPWKNLTTHLKFGYGYITEGSGKRVPVFERFYLGGIDSVRGYKYGDISPRDPTTGERIGGTKMFYFQGEGIIPLIKSINLHGVLFYDMGSVWSKEHPFKSSEIRKSVGFGVRWLSPLGPLRIEWGYNIDKKPKEDSSNLNFQIGGGF